MRALLLIVVFIPSFCQLPPQPDYLRSADPVAQWPTEVTQTGVNEITLSNGLISRVFGTAPNFYTKDYRSEGI